MADTIIDSGSGTYIGRRFDVTLSAELRHRGNEIFNRFFDGTNVGIISERDSTILIPDHYFITGEKLEYRYSDYEKNDSSKAVGIATTSIPGIGVTDKLPRTVYAVKINDRQIKLSATLEQSLKRIPETLGLTTSRVRNSYHQLIGEKQNSRSLLTIDNIIQSPIISTAVTCSLVSDLPAASDVVILSGITSFFSGDLIKVGSEVMRINYLGLGNENAIIVRRPMLGTKSIDHSAGSLVTKLKGNFNIIDNTVYFPVAPFGKSPVSDPENRNPAERDYIGIETSSTFDGRVFLRSGFVDTNVAPYDKNYIFDDVSTKFVGITTAAIITSDRENISGFSTGNGVVLINNIFQTPDFFDYGFQESAGITTIYFTGYSNRNDEDINTASIPRGGIILSIASTEGFGYQPLVAAGGTCLVSAAGTIQTVSIGNTGSGYRAAEYYEYQTKVSSYVAPNGNVIPINDVNGLFYCLNKIWDGSNIKIQISNKINCDITAINANSVEIPTLLTSSQPLLQNDPVLLTVESPQIPLINVYVQKGSSVGIPTVRHIGISTVLNGNVCDFELTNVGSGFTNFNQILEYETSLNILSGSTEIPLNKLTGITSDHYISVGSTYNQKIVGVGSTAITIQNPVPSNISVNTKAIIKSYDYLELIFDSPLSYNDLLLEYSKDSPQGGIGTYGRINVVVGQGSSVIDFEIKSYGYSYGQGEILTVPVGGPTGIPTLPSTMVIGGISTDVGILTGSRTTDINSDEFGTSVAISSDANTIAVGALYGFTPSSPSDQVGAVYIFDRSGNNFSEVGILTGTYALNSGDSFGKSIAMSSDGLSFVVGSPSDENGVTLGTGVVYIFDRVGNNFNQVGILTGSLASNTNDNFGYSVDINSDGDVIVVGALNDEGPSSSSNSGVTYVFGRTAGPTFNQIGILTGYYASNSLDNYGNSVAISGNGSVIAIGAINDEIPLSGNESGVVYVYEKTGSTFTNVGILTGSSSIDVNDNFGQVVSINYDGSIIAVGAPNDNASFNEARSGVVYIFEKTLSGYQEIQSLCGEFATEFQDNFGYSISMNNSGSIVAIGANSDEYISQSNNISMGSSSGIVYIYERKRKDVIFNNDYIRTGIITSYYANKDNDKFGSSLSLNSEGSSLIIGAPFDNADGSGGHSYVFDIDLVSSFKEFKITIDKTFNDDFSGWTFGDLTVFDSIDRLFNGRRKVFPLRKGGRQTTVKTRPGSPIELQYNLLVFVNDIYQVPNYSYVFNGGSFIRFTEPPQNGDKCIIIFYSGTTEVDTKFVDILETIKVGDEITLNDKNLQYQEIPRTVTEIKATDVVSTNIYPGPGLSVDPEYERNVTWCKQTEDKVVDGSYVGKDREPIEALFYPKTKIIQSVGIGSTEVIFVENLKTFFDSNNEYEDAGIIKRPQKKILIISNDSLVSASATCTVSYGSSISSISLINGGVGYTTNPDVTIAPMKNDPGKIIGTETGNLLGIVTSYNFKYIFDRDIVGENATFDITVNNTLTLSVDTPGYRFFIQKVPPPFSAANLVTDDIVNNGSQFGTIIWTPKTRGTYYYTSQNNPALSGIINVVSGITNVDSNIRATAKANISNGVVTSIDVVEPGLGYTNTTPPTVFISPPSSYYEKIEQVDYLGDFGWVTGIGTTSIPGIANTGLVFDFFIPPDSYARDTDIVTNPDNISGIETGYYFVLRKTIVGNGLNSLRTNNTVVSYGSSFIDNVYQAAKVSIGQTIVVGYGVTDIVKVVVSLENYNGLGNISTSGYYQGDFSWGLIYNLKRSIPRSFNFYNVQNDGLSGIQSSPDVIRINPLKYFNYTGINRNR